MDAIHLPVGLTLPSAFGAPAAPLQTGQVIQALVLQLIESDIFRLQLPQAVIDIRSSVPLTPGNTVTLAVKGTGPGARLAIYTDVPVAVPAARGPAPAPSVAGRTPIGEAVIIARTPGGQGPSNSQRIATDAKAIATAPARLPNGPAALRESQASTAAPAARQPETSVRLITSEQAVTEAIQASAPRQAGLAPLFADLAQIAQGPAESSSPLPAPVRDAAADVLSLRVPLGAQLTAADVKQAFVRSGILFEPKLAAAATPSRVGQAEPAFAPTPRDDLKAALLVLRQVLKASAPAEPAAARPAVLPSEATAPAQAAPQASPDTIRNVQVLRQIASALAAAPEEPVSALPANSMSADEATGLAKTLATALNARDPAPLRQAPSAVVAPPPYRGAPPAAQAIAVPSISSDTAPQQIADKLIAETDGAIARTTLLQVASLPDQQDQARAEATQRWNFEVPLATPQGTAIAQFEVSRDARVARADPQTRTWRARFSLDVEPTGPVHALIALRGARTSVTLWAERAATAARLNAHAAMLSDALRAAELEPVDFSARLGTPPMARAAAPGRFMDRAS